MLDESVLRELYLKDKKSVLDIGKILGCSAHKVSYWMAKYSISLRTYSEATYVKRNPNGDPFVFRYPSNTKEAQLFGLGLGLYWGEGNKANLNSVRLGNTNPILIETFIDFLITFFQIEKKDLKFGLQLFSDMDPEEALDFWVKQLNIHRSQINKPVITISGSIGTYRNKSQYGVLTVMYHNKKLRDVLVGLLPM
jgi:hypothetical protein